MPNQQTVTTPTSSSTGARAACPARPSTATASSRHRDAVVLPEVPAKLIVGVSGAIGMEFSYVYSTYGAEVTVIEMPDQIPAAGRWRSGRRGAEGSQERASDSLTSTRTEKVA